MSRGACLALLMFQALAPAWGAESGEEGSTLIRQDVTIRPKAAGGQAIRVPTPGPAPAVLREAIESLDLYKRAQPGSVQTVKVDATRKRLQTPFPRAPFLVFSVRNDMDFSLWRFDILDDEKTVWHASGEGPVGGQLEWDGTGYSGAVAVRIGKPYRWRFTASLGAERYAAQSEPVTLTSVLYREALGAAHMEVANDLIFEPKSAKLSKSATDYLKPMAERLRATEARELPYRFTIHQASSDPALAQGRADALRKYFSKYLVISPTNIEVESRSSQERGDVTDCPIP
ncbi:MAG: hypothetical protein HY927_00840 [Elusimicrobia bacterium]|nr:hypothetical protein [Elusimicrobiota bacterium]